MGKIRDENYYIIHGWMINQLGLKGTQLQVYAIIYGFSQDGENEFSGSLSYLCEFTRSSKPTVIKALSDLCESGALTKRSEKVNGVVFNYYSASLPVVKKFNQGSKEILPPQLKNFTGGGKETLPNKEYYKEEYKEYDKERVALSLPVKKNGQRFIPPTVGEVRAYCQEIGSTINPDSFVDYYEANGWVQGKGKPIKDWKAAVRTWQKRESPKPFKNDVRPEKSRGTSYDMDMIKLAMMEVPK